MQKLRRQDLLPRPRTLAWTSCIRCRDMNRSPGAGRDPEDAVLQRRSSRHSNLGRCGHPGRTVFYPESAPAEAASPQAAPAQRSWASRLASGQAVTALPSGCQSTHVDGVSLFNCGGVTYQPTFQVNNLVYGVK